MRDVVLDIRFLRASLFAGLAFLGVSCIAAVLLMVFVFDSGGRGLSFSLLIAIACAFPLGAVFGHPLLYKRTRFSSLRVLMIGILVPALATTAVVLEAFGMLSAVHFAPAPARSDGFLTTASLFFDDLLSLGGIFLIAQTVTGWLTYPCGIAAAYFLGNLGSSAILSEPKVIALFGQSKSEKATGTELDAV